MKKILMGVLSLAVVVTMLFGTATMVFADDGVADDRPFQLKEIVKGEDYPYGGDYNKLMIYWKYPDDYENCEFRLQFKKEGESEYKNEIPNLIEGEYIDVSKWDAGKYILRVAAYKKTEPETETVANNNDHQGAGITVRNPIKKIKATEEPLDVTNEESVEISPKTTTAEVTTDAAEDGDDDDGDDGDGSEVGSEVVEGTDDSDSSPETGQLIFMGVIGAMAISGGLGIYARRKFGKEE